MSLVACSTPAGRSPRDAAVESREPRQIAIVGVTVIDPSSASLPATDQTIVLEGDRIVAVGARERTAVPPGATVLDAAGKFAIPGLWDAHVHFMNAGVSALPVLVAQGVTSVREMGGFLDSTRAWQARMAAGTLIGPRIVTPGPILESPQYLQNVRERSARLGGQLALRVLPYRLGVASEDDARRVVDTLVALGVDFVKIRTVASAPVYFAILREARRAGLHVAGHSPFVVASAIAADSGQQDIEHALLLSTPPARESLYGSFARNHTWYTPTLVVSRVVTLSADSANRAIFGPEAMRLDKRRRYASSHLLGWWRMQVDERMADTSTVTVTRNRQAFANSLVDVRELHAAGVRILAGTDAGSVLVYPGWSLHEELELLVEAGLTPQQALWSATVGPAQFARLSESLGTIAAGKLADLVLLNASPLSDIRNTRRIDAVIQGGRVFRRSQLDSVLASVRALNSPR